ncbi:MAG TPA: SigE family RNA polymerase sigma factor [Actinomycetota bacterium]
MAQLYAVHIDEAFRIAYLLTGNRQLAEDLAQDGFLRLMGRLVHLRPSVDFGAYLRRTVVNLVNSHYRRRRVEQRYLQREGGMPPPDAKGPDLGDRDRMRLALLTLPRRQRTAVVLRYYADLSDRQAAEIMGCRPSTVRALVSRGMASLRSQVGGSDDQ